MMTKSNHSDSVLALDIGTTSLKAAVTGRHGEVFSFYRIEYSTLPPQKKSRISETWICAVREVFLRLNGSFDFSAVCISGNGPTIVSQDGTTLLFNDGAKAGIGGRKNPAGKKSAEELFSKITVPDAHRFVYEERLKIFSALYPEIWASGERLYSGPDYLAKILEERLLEFGLKEKIPVFVCGPDFIAAITGCASFEPGRLCDRAGSSEGINLCILKEKAEGFLKNRALRVMCGIAAGARDETFCNVSFLIPDPGKSHKEKTENFSKGISVIRKAAEKAGAEISDTIVITGGQTLDEKLVQKKADAADIKIALPQIPDAELLGDAAYAFYRLGLFSGTKSAAESLLKIKKIFYPLKAIIFDIDSTLYTNKEYAFEIVDCQVRHFAKIRGISEDAARKMVEDYRKKYEEENGGKKIGLANTLKTFGISIEESIEWRKNLLEPAAFLSKDRRLYTALFALSKKYKLICVTNNPDLPARKTLKALGVEDLFIDVIGLDVFKKSKPATEPFLLAAKKCGALPQECLSVGDRYDLDLAPAAGLGMRTLLVQGVSDVYRMPKDF